MKRYEHYYRYYSTQRPVSMGTYPTANVVAFENFDNREFIEDEGIRAWGYLIYSDELTQKQMDDYELVKAKIDVAII